MIGQRNDREAGHRKQQGGKPEGALFEEAERENSLAKAHGRIVSHRRKIWRQAQGAMRVEARSDTAMNSPSRAQEAFQSTLRAEARSDEFGAADLHGFLNLSIRNASPRYAFQGNFEDFKNSRGDAGRQRVIVFIN
jgi:hypothetical protein